TDPNVTTGYPPRADLVKNTSDSPSVDTYKAMNPFDAVSQPTPAAGTATHAPFSAQMGPGDYVLYVETAKEMDFNASYSAQMYPSPTGISFSEYGLPYRGQPSVVYRVPFTIAASPTSALTTDYFGYGDPDGKDGTVRSPDQTITIDTPGSGGARLQLTTDGTDMYRVKVTIDPNQGGGPPPAPDMLAVTNVDASAISLQFLAPGIGADHAKVSSYEIRVRAGSPMTADNFADSMPVSATVAPNDPGKLQSVDLDGLLPQTDYWIGIRAFDDCHNAGDIAIAQVTTTERVSGSVDACFIATAAYGSLMANDVELLRHVRDTMLRTTALGELGVEAYYTFGPAFAGVIGESDLVRATARASLDPVITRVKRLAK
ncbi:MAG TPA: CFI-box-CTERM domain-containing protein, partial [Kofleriaceae bacterium]